LAIEALLECNKTTAYNVAAIFNGQVVIVIVVILSFLVFLYTSETLTERGAKKSSISELFVSLSRSDSTTSQQQQE
jgi:predicted ABC-type exoprotein transport system permease subunit